ncbi:hypothetical protein [Actinoplanes aureus]|uniref:Uncharacterized protein n=1 Tax=Actinoplanes aureus TaxID=2792083 RepID=A0A931G1W6_9ACTN|nr:hypothetical protein [Actinoplanes aureus]MBG0568378.1 hypothetical protein [Actinoplanes aureus]
MAEQHIPAESKKIHGDKLAEAFAHADQGRDEEPESESPDVRLLSRHPGAKTSHVVRR